MDRFCPKCGAGLKSEFWREKKFFRCISNPGHFFSEEVLEAIGEEVDMTLGFMSSDVEDGRKKDIEE